MLSLFGSGSTWAQDFTRDELEALVNIREADLGVERVYADDDPGCG